MLSVDDTVIDKPYSKPAAAELVDFFWSGLHHKSVKGINLIVLNYTDPEGVSLPVNWRVYRKRDNKTKNDYFQDMVSEVLGWGLRPAWITADRWYSSVENLKFLRNKEVGFLVGLEKNRIISTVPHSYEAVGQAQIGEEGLYTHLKGFDYVKVFRTEDTEGHTRHYAMYGNEQQPTASLSRVIFKEVKQQHWHIEQAFRAIKQLVHAGHFFVRRTKAVQTHLFCVLRALQRLVLWTKDEFHPSTNYTTSYSSPLNVTLSLTLRNSYISSNRSGHHRHIDDRRHVITLVLYQVPEAFLPQPIVRNQSDGAISYTDY